MMLTLSLLALIMPLTQQAADPIDAIGKQSADIFSNSQMRGQTIRQCSCDEQKECVDLMKAQLKQCTEPCFDKFNSITDKPAQLKKCFNAKDDLLESFLSCFEQRVEGCVDNDNGKQINKTDISALFSLSEKKIVSQTASMQAIIAPIKNIIDAAGEFALCTKNCFLEKNRNGFCFDEKNCQPLIHEAKAQRSLKQCTRKLNWKQEAGEFCNCSVDAGVTVLKQYCSMFSLMAKRRPQSPRRH